MMSAEYLCHDQSGGVEWFGAEAPKFIGESEGANLSRQLSSQSFLLFFFHISTSASSSLFYHIRDDD